MPTLEMTKTVRDITDIEVMLKPASEAVAPMLRCSNCGYTRAYTYYYRKLGFQQREVDFCPGCGFPIGGVWGHE